MPLRPSIACLLLAAACGGTPARTASAQLVECTVTRLSDGDSFRCADGARVRLIGLDAPELGQGEAGRAARDALERLLPKDRVLRLELDVAPRDRYGRRLAYAWRGSVLLNEAMLRGGWAMLYTLPPNVKYVRRLEAAQRAAREGRAGLWATGGFACAPRDFRRRACR
jgi:micrococcal nuclease